METDRHGYCEHNRRDHKCWECQAQRARAAELRVAELEEAISKLLFSPIGDIRTVMDERDSLKAQVTDLQAQLERAKGEIARITDPSTKQMAGEFEARLSETAIYEGSDLYGLCEDLIDALKLKESKLREQLDRATEPRAIDPDYHERCEDELQWWRQTHTDEEPPADIWKESACTPATKRLFIDGKPGPPLSMGFKTEPRADAKIEPPSWYSVAEYIRNEGGDPDAIVAEAAKNIDAWRGESERVRAAVGEAESDDSCRQIQAEWSRRYGALRDATDERKEAGA
jgi:hypothetical protein